MTVTVTTVFDGVDTFIADVEVTADADTTATIAHGLAGSPQAVYLTPLIQPPFPRAALVWAATTIDAANCVIEKQPNVGSGHVGAQVRCVIKRPHSIGR